MDKKKFPKNFIFGTAVASYQVEGGIYNNDWTIWENNKNSKCEELCGEACKHYELVNEDIKLLKNLGIRAFRFSIEWSRIQPEKNKYDQEAIQHYVDKTKKLIENNIEPIITFHHFTTPEWVFNEGSWANNKIVNYFNDYVDKMMQFLPKEII